MTMKVFKTTKVFKTMYEKLRGSALVDASTPFSNACLEKTLIEQYSNGADLVFQNGVLKINNPFTLKCDSGEVVILSALIGCSVSDIYPTATDLVLVFDGRILISISLREEDYIGLDALTFHHKNTR